MNDQSSTHSQTNELKEHVKDTNVWIRLLFMLLFSIIYSVAEVVIAVVVFFQFLHVLFTGKKNEKVLSLGSQLSSFAYQVFSYLTYNSEVKPFPFTDWPSDRLLAEKQEEEKAARRRAPARKAAAKPAKAASTKAKAAETEAAKADEEKPAES